MSEAAQLDEPPVTIAGFDVFLDGQADPRPWELVAGRIVGMADACFGVDLDGVRG